MSTPPTQEGAPPINDDEFTVELLNVEQAARRLGTDERFVRRLINERRIRYYKVGKYVRFHPNDIAEFIRAGRVDPIRPALTYRKGASVYG